MPPEVTNPNALPNWNDALSRELAQRLEELQEFTHRHRARIDNAEAVLIAQLEQLMTESRSGDSKTDADLPKSLAKKRRQLETAYEELKERRARTRRQRRRLAERLQKHREERKHSPSANGDHAELQQEFSDLQARYEMSLEELRELKQRCEGLEEQLASQPAASGPSSASHMGAFDWEAQKRRMMEAMNTDFNEQDPHSRQEKLTADETIRVTDAIVAEKDREIAELKEQLAARPAESPPAPLSPDVVEALNIDEVVCQERERLTQLEADLQEKLRVAEIELSQSRAALARERAELAEQRRILEEERMVLESKVASAEADESKGPSKGRWLARLGLQEPKKE